MDKRLCLANVIGVVLLLLAFCLVPVIAWLIWDALGPERVEPSTPWLVVVACVLLALTWLGNRLSAVPSPDRRVLQLSKVLRHEFEIRKALGSRQVAGLLCLLFGAVSLGFLIAIGLWVLLFWAPLLLLLVGVLLAIGPVVRPPTLQEGMIDRTATLRPAHGRRSRRHPRHELKI